MWSRSRGKGRRSGSRCPQAKPSRVLPVARARTASSCLPSPCWMSLPRASVHGIVERVIHVVRGAGMVGVPLEHWERQRASTHIGRHVTHTAAESHQREREEALGFVVGKLCQQLGECFSVQGVAACLASVAVAHLNRAQREASTAFGRGVRRPRSRRPRRPQRRRARRSRTPSRAHRGCPTTRAPRSSRARRSMRLPSALRR